MFKIFCIIWLVTNSPPSEEGGSAGGALGLDVILLEDDALVREVVQVRGDDGGVVPGHVIVAQVIGQDEHYVRRTSEKCQHNEKEGWKVSQIPVLSAFVFVAMALVTWNKDELILMRWCTQVICNTVWNVLESLPSLLKMFLNVKVKLNLNVTRPLHCFRAPIFLSTSWNLKTQKFKHERRLSVSKAEKNSNLICIQIEDVQITYVRSKKTCTLYLVLSCRSCFEVGGVWRIEDRGGWRMVPWLVIVLDVGGSVIFLSSYNLHMSLEASRAWHENRAVLITPSWTHFNCQQVHK